MFCGDEVDFDNIFLIWFWLGDVGGVIMFGLVIIKDFEIGVFNVGVYWF